MNYIEFILLGIIQGITEFLPISSSGHLLLGRTIFGLQIENISNSFIEVFLHGGTLLSILVFWKNDILQDLKDTLANKSKIYYHIIIATIPAALIGFLFKDVINSYFFNINNIQYLCITYLILAIILYSTKFKINSKYNELFYSLAFAIGLIQCFAILPGISRSGITIACGLLLGVRSEAIVKFSFMLAIPILLFSFIYSVFNNYLLLVNSELWFSLILGFVSSFIAGYLCIGILVNLIKKNKLWYFSYYCILISFIIGIKYGI